MATKVKLDHVEAQAAPSKDFFISMLTRDILLVDAILDLIDNSIDSIVYGTDFDPMLDLLGSRSRKRVSLNKFKIEINFDDKNFSITDNAFGISLKDAEDRVFRFGADAARKGKNGSLSVYGIGMKRACYKIGNALSISSVTNKTYLEVSYDVEKWLNDNDWKLDIGWRKKGSGDQRGTNINVGKLHPEIKKNFKLGTFEADLLEKIGSAYSLFIEKGLEIKVNGILAKSHVPTLPESENVKSSRKKISKDGVQTLIIAGINHNEEGGSGGWYVFCNGRMILEADKTPKTGWGNDMRKFHQAINPFLGFVYFQSSDLEKLPWTTTKDNINFESPIYQYALARMKVMATPIVRLLGRRYNEKRVASEYDKTLSSTKTLELTKLDKKDRDFSFKISNDVKKEEIAFLVDSGDLKRAKNTIGKPSMSNAKVGEYVFDYFVKRECDD